MALTNKPNTQQSLYECYCKDTEVLAIDYTHGVMAKAAYNISEDQRVAKLVNAQGRSTKFDLVTKLQSVPVFRYAETLLNLSECYVKVNRTEDAVTALTQVRRRSVSAENDIIELETLTEDALLEAIADEKRLEFIGEGISGIEIIRKGQTFEKGFSVAPSHSGYTWPIPQTERVVNKEWND